jgi:hypothetical protein
MMRGLEKRLRRLELAVPPLPDADICHIYGLKWFGVAYYLGHPSSNEKPFAAFARALGYADETELNSALIDRYFVVSDRLRFAEHKLFEKFGINLDKLDEVDPLKFKQGLERMEAGLPKSYKKELNRVLARRDINLLWIWQHEGIAPYIRCFA